jgi:ATP-binding cassette subfamily F protein 3
LTQVRAFEKQQKVISKEQDYIARNIAGQNSRQAKGRRTRLARMPRLSAPPEAGDVMALRLDLDERGGDQVLVADHVTISVGGRQLVRDFSGRVRRGDVVGLIGPNGAGKSSLIRAIVGEATPAAGELRLGASVQPGYYRQDLMQIPATETLYDVIAGLRPMWERGRIQHHLGRFGFSGDAVTRRAGTLSGGEQARLALAMLMLSRSNLLIFDEPTNHLDVETIEALEDAISAYEGSVLLVSHDRALLRALVTKVWGLADGRITEFDGSFDEWEELETERRAKVAAADADARLRERERAAQQASRHASATDAARARDRETRRAVERLESAISETESRIEQLTAQLADTSLYATEDGIAKAHELDRALAADRAELERLVAEWERAMANLDGAGTPTG